MDKNHTHNLGITAFELISVEIKTLIVLNYQVQ